MTDADPTSYDVVRRRYALRVDPRPPELMPLDLMGALWVAIGEAAERAGYRAYFTPETGAGVCWFERDPTSYDVGTTRED